MCLDFLRRKQPPLKVSAFAYNVETSFPTYFAPVLSFGIYLFHMNLHFRCTYMYIVYIYRLYIYTLLYNMYAYFLRIYIHISCVYTPPKCNATVTWKLYKMAYGYIFSKAISSEKEVQIVTLRHPNPIPFYDFFYIIKGCRALHNRFYIGFDMNFSFTSHQPCSDLFIRDQRKGRCYERLWFEPYLPCLHGSCIENAFIM